MFRRRHREATDETGPGPGTAQDDADMQAGYDDDEDLSEDDGDEKLREEDGEDGQAWDEDDADAEDEDAASGPWDGAGDFPHRERVDFGSLLVPLRDGLDVQLNMSEDQGVWVAVVHGESSLQLQAFAAPKTSSLWDEVRPEIAEEVAKSGGHSEEAPGPFGTELRARIGGAQPGRHQPVRFMGVDGPRWFLRGVISGPAARHPELARPFEELFADVVVVRGDHPAPPRDLLEIRLPEDAQKALEEHLGQEGEGLAYPNPFERGPEITEIR